MPIVFTPFFNEVSKYRDEGLRDYQAHHKRDIYNRWKDVNSILLQMPTGTGKTRLFVSMINDFKQYSESHKIQLKSLIITHRKELVEQIRNELYWNYDIKSTLITADNKDSHYNPLPVCIASIQTLQRRLEAHWYNYPFDFIIVDEAHHSKARTYKKVLDAYGHAKILGVTATPYRLNGEGFTDEYRELIISPSVKRYIEAGWLSNYDYYSIKEDSDLYKGLDDIPLDKYGEYATTPLWNYINKDRIRSEIVGSYLKYAKGKKAIIYTINKAHNKQLCEGFKECGVVAYDIDSDTSGDERKRIVQYFREGKIDVLCNVDIFTEGFDCPDVEVIQLARPTKSLGLYLQQVGRGLRIAEGKRKVLFLDNVGLYNRFGFPASKRMWRKHFLGQEVDEASRFVSKLDYDEPFEMEKRHQDLSEGCEKMTLIDSTGINKVIEEAKSDYLVEKVKKLKKIVNDVFETNQRIYEEFVVGYSEMHMSYSSELVDDLVNPCTSIYSECEDLFFWKKKIKKEFKPIIKNNDIVYENYLDLDDYIRTKSKMILSRFKSELSKSQSFLFEQLNEYTAEQLYYFFANEYVKNHIMTKKFESFCLCGYGKMHWKQMVEMWNSPELERKLIIKRSDNNIKDLSERQQPQSFSFSVGDRVTHYLWGEGTINEIVLNGSLYGILFDSLPSQNTYVKPQVLLKENSEVDNDNKTIIRNSEDEINNGSSIYRNEETEVDNLLLESFSTGSTTELESESLSIINSGKGCRLVNTQNETVFSSMGKLLRIRGNFFRVNYLWSSVTITILGKHNDGMYYANKRIILARYHTALFKSINRNTYMEQIEDIRPLVNNQEKYRVKISGIWYDGDGNIIR